MPTTSTKRTPSSHKPFRDSRVGVPHTIALPSPHPNHIRNTATISMVNTSTQPQTPTSMSMSIWVWIDVGEATPSRAGTPGYLPPEFLWESGEAGAENDVFSFAVVVLEMLVLHDVWENNMFTHSVSQVQQATGREGGNTQPAVGLVAVALAFLSCNRGVFRARDSRKLSVLFRTMVRPRQHHRWGPQSFSPRVSFPTVCYSLPPARPPRCCDLAA